MVFLFVVAVTLYIINSYKINISEKTVNNITNKIDSAPNYSNKVYKIFCNIELDTTATAINALQSDRYSNAPSRLIARNLKKLINSNDLEHLNWLREFSFAMKLDRTIRVKKMTDYLITNVSFGPDIRGLDNASSVFFNKKTDLLNDRELISICAVLKANTLYNPFINPIRNNERTVKLIRTLKSKGIQLDSSCD